jgi:NitT/TauT family transport system ATP-binding protein
LTVRGNVKFGLTTAGVEPQDSEERVRTALQLVGLNGFGAKYPHTLSGGMRQRAAIARVLVLEPQVLLMDEPFGALDANSRERLQDEVLRIWENRRRTVLFVTHNVDEAAYLADRVIVMGPPPRSICDEVVIELARPRDRSSTALREKTGELRRLLNQMPCCIAPQ